MGVWEDDRGAEDRGRGRQAEIAAVAWLEVPKPTTEHK